MHIIFSHGKESGPNGNKIIQLSRVAEAMVCTTESVDYQGMESPQERVNRLIEVIKSTADEVVLVGSSMGGFVSLAATVEWLKNQSSTQLSENKIKGMFLLVPAAFMSGYPAIETLEQFPPLSIVHGWKDDIVPYQNSLKLAEIHEADYHLLNDGHRLKEVLPQVVEIFKAFLGKALK